MPGDRGSMNPSGGDGKIRSGNASVSAIRAEFCKTEEERQSGFSGGVPIAGAKTSLQGELRKPVFRCRTRYILPFCRTLDNCAAHPRSSIRGMSREKCTIARAAVSALRRRRGTEGSDHTQFLDGASMDGGRNGQRPGTRSSFSLLPASVNTASLIACSIVSLRTEPPRCRDRPSVGRGVSLCR